MRTALADGTELVTTSPEELRAEVARQLDPLTSRPDVIKAAQTFGTGAGAILLGQSNTQPGQTVWEVPMGTRAYVERVVLWSPQYTPAAVLAAGWITLHVNDILRPPFKFWPRPGSTQTIPHDSTEGEDQAELLNPGDKIVLNSGAIPANVSVTVTLQLKAWRIRGRRD